MMALEEQFSITLDEEGERLIIMHPWLHCAPVASAF